MSIDINHQSNQRSCWLCVCVHQLAKRSAHFNTTLQHIKKHPVYKDSMIKKQKPYFIFKQIVYLASFRPSPKFTVVSGSIQQGRIHAMYIIFHPSYFPLFALLPYSLKVQSSSLYTDQIPPRIIQCTNMIIALQMSARKQPIKETRSLGHPVHMCCRSRSVCVCVCV